ncbi:cupin domain-containing protein [Nocardia sp. NPDC051911]|uniref:JmjC domain-containing protein n=1 Tax=Nocardia sp. NPDC051911 TaxID=3154648 RepID=UPI00342444A9
MSTRAPVFDELVGDEQVFFREYFDRMPLLRRAAIQGDVREVLRAEDLDELLHRESLRLPYVSIFGRESSYQVSRLIHGKPVTDCVAPERVHEHFLSGATIQWYSMNHFFPNLRELTSMLARKFASRSEVIAFLSAAGAKESAGCHQDPVDLFIIQVEGTKNWKVWAPRKGEPTSHEPDELGEPLIDTDLAPGDVLYMPYGTPHLVSSKNAMSLHLSVAVKPRKWSELLIDIVGDIVNGDAAFRGFPHLDEQLSDEQADTLERLAGLLAERIALIDPKARLQQLARAGRDAAVPSNGHVFGDAAGIDRAQKTTGFKRGPAEVLFGDTDDGTCTLEIRKTTSASMDGKVEHSIRRTRIKVPEKIAAGLRHMTEGDILTAEDVFPVGDAERSLEVAKSLARMDILQPVRLPSR